MKAIEKTNKLSLALADYVSGLSRQERLNRSEMIKRIVEVEILLEEIKILSEISEMVDKSIDEQIKKIKKNIKKEIAENEISED